MNVFNRTKILELHALYLVGDVRGVRADLSGADLSGADLSRANLSRADLSYTDLSYTDLGGANLSRAILSRANLSRADLSRANLSYTDLSGANLSGADLSRANLRGANLRGTGFVADSHRPDGYQHVAIRGEVEGSVLIHAGCRAFTSVEEARRHWGVNHERGSGCPLNAFSLAWLDMVETLLKNSVR